MHLPLNALRAFEASARHLNLTRAAQELHVTQTAVSQHIRNLEERLGKPLFRRLPRGLALTDEGQALLPTLMRWQQSVDPTAMTEICTVFGVQVLSEDGTPQPVKPGHCPWCMAQTAFALPAPAASLPHPANGVRRDRCWLQG